MTASGSETTTRSDIRSMTGDEYVQDRPKSPIIMPPIQLK
jgi:hypothetical protein